MGRSDSIAALFALCRVGNLPTVWTNVLAAVVLSGAEFSWPRFLVLVSSMSLYYAGGMCLNDIVDAPLDRIAKPFRPLPAGLITIRAAGVAAVSLFAAASLLLLWFPDRRVILAGLCLLLLIVLYDVYHKANPASVLLMAACRGMIFPIAALAAVGAVGWAVGVGGSAQFLYVVLLSVVARQENKSRVSRAFPVIPVMLAGISLLDGVLMAVFGSPAWLGAGLGGALLTHLGQKVVKGD